VGFCFGSGRRRQSIWLIGVLRVAGVAVHACRLVAHHGFDRMGQHKFALAAPTVDRVAYLSLPVYRFGRFHI
jgi:hypothetical protein